MNPAGGPDEPSLDPQGKRANAGRQATGSRDQTPALKEPETVRTQPKVAPAQTR